ncbi:rab11 family-interacting protein 4B [Vespula squamosa]|uniref:Rab11 family-interacting protein 4B n=1 Tax=Vespula squamosa TaxID=30214 RepID=A0ABD2A020_VESSQ
MYKKGFRRLRITGTLGTCRNPRSPNSTIGRHSWLRTSLRRTPPCSGRKRISSNALASQLYRSGSFNSSGRGSNCDNTDDMYSDVSLEEDIFDLNHKLLMCAIKQSCDSPSCLSHSTRQSDRIKLPSSHHSGPSYGYCPQPYPRYIQYEPYGVHHHHPIPNYPSSCYNNHENLDEVFSESKGKLSGQSWYLIIILIVIILVLGFALYRTLSRTGQRFRSVRQNNFVPPTQIVRKKKDAIQNCPAEFVRCAGMISELRKECSMPCKQCRKFPVNISSPKIYRPMQITSSGMDEDEESLNVGIIDITRSKTSVATDTPKTSSFE